MYGQHIGDMVIMLINYNYVIWSITALYGHIYDTFGQYYRSNMVSNGLYMVNI